MKKLLWIHEKALSKKNLEGFASDNENKTVFIWDDNYFKNRGYSLKRLVFIYETICEMGVEIVYGDIFEVIDELSPAEIITHYNADIEIQNIIEQASTKYKVRVIRDKSFVDIPEDFRFTRFFKYWSTAKKTAFRHSSSS